MCEGSIFHFRARRGESRDTIIIPEGERESSRRRRERSERKKEEMEDEIRTNCKKNEEQKERTWGMGDKEDEKRSECHSAFLFLTSFSHLDFQSLIAVKLRLNLSIDLKISGNYKEALSGELTSFRGGLLSRHAQPLWSFCIHLFLDRCLISTRTFMSGKSKYILFIGSIKRLRLRISLHKLHVYVGRTQQH